MNNMSKIFFCLSFFISMLGFAESKKIPAIDKPIFSVNYDVSFNPYVDKFLYSFSKSKLSSLHRGSISFLYPYFRYLNLGASLDFTIIKSTYNRDPRLDLSKDNSKIAPLFLGFSLLVRPQLPIFVSSDFEILLFQENQLGIGSVSPITFGTQPLTERYVFLSTSNIPTPFPLIFETTPKLGLQFFGWGFFGFDVSLGYRMLWIMHPLVNSGRASQDTPKDDRGTVYYDVTSLFMQTSFKFAF